MHARTHKRAHTLAIVRQHFAPGQVQCNSGLIKPQTALHFEAFLAAGRQRGQQLTERNCYNVRVVPAHVQYFNFPQQSPPVMSICHFNNLEAESKERDGEQRLLHNLTIP